MRKRGDTLIEVMIAVGIFGLVAVGAISLMNRGLATAQTTLETTMARQEIDTQAEALRFIHNAYLSKSGNANDEDTEAEDTTYYSYRNLWKDLIAKAYSPVANASNYYADGYTNGKNITDIDPRFYSRTVENGKTCGEIFYIGNEGTFATLPDSFVINPRALIDPQDSSFNTSSNPEQARIAAGRTLRSAIVSGATQEAATYPRLLYNSLDNDALSDVVNPVATGSRSSNLYSAEGIWVTPVASEAGLQCKDANGQLTPVIPDYYDFHIQTCWEAAGGKTASVISSTVRLFNPNQIDLSKKVGTITFDNVEWEAYDNTQHTGQTCGSEVAPGHHTVASGTDIEFIGYTADAMDEGVRYSLADMRNFSLDVDVDVSGILTHPGGEGLIISIGPIRAELARNIYDYNNGGYTSGSIITAGGDTKEISGNTFHLSMTRSGNSYKACADSVCVETTSDEADIKVDFNFKHSGHCCTAISRAKLSNIEMAGNSSQESTSSSNCYRIDTPEGNGSGIGGETGEQNPPAPQSEPEPADDIEETIVSTETNPLQNVVVKFDLTDYEDLTLKSANTISSIPNANKVASGLIAENGSCNIMTTHNATGCTFPYAYQNDSLGRYVGFAEGTFVIYFDMDSFVKRANGPYGTPAAISNFWDYKDLNVNVYFYDHIYYYWELVNHEEQLARYKISSKTAKVIDNNGRYWILARIYGSPDVSRNYWVTKMEIINQRTNTSPAAYLK